MTRDVRITSFVTILLLATPLLAGSTTVRPLDGRELVRGSSDIVIGTVIARAAHWDERHRRILTDVQVLVSERLKGAGADTLSLTQLGGEVDGARYDVPGSPVYTVGEEVLLFAWRDRFGRLQANGLAQGKCSITRDAAGVRVVRGLPEELRGARSPAAPSRLRPERAADGEPVPLSGALRALRDEISRK